MSREPKTAEEIQAEVRRLIRKEADGGNNPGITVPLPERLVEAGAGECNWDMTYFGHAIPDPEAIEAAMEDVKARWNLR